MRCSPGASNIHPCPGFLSYREAEWPHDHGAEGRGRGHGCPAGRLVYADCRRGPRVTVRSPGNNEPVPDGSSARTLRGQCLHRCRRVPVGVDHAYERFAPGPHERDHAGAGDIGDDGTGLWWNPTISQDDTRKYSHPDMAYFGDFDWDKPGMELFIGAEGNGWTGGLFNAKTGERYWNTKLVTESQGTVGDLDLSKPGLEIYARTARSFNEAESGNVSLMTWDCKGNHGGTYGLTGGRPTTVWFTGSEKSDVPGRNGIPGSSSSSTLAADIMGDWREELLVVNGNARSLTIYSPTGPCELDLPSLRTDRQYRTHMARGQWATGYSHRPMLSCRLIELGEGGEAGVAPADAPALRPLTARTTALPSMAIDLTGRLVRLNGVDLQRGAAPGAYVLRLENRGVATVTGGSRP